MGGNMAAKPILDQEYIYNADGTGEFRTVNIALELTEMEEIVTLKPQQNMTMGEIDRALKGFEEDILHRMQMRLGESHPVQLEYKGKIFKISFENGKVSGISAK